MIRRTGDDIAVVDTPDGVFLAGGGIEGNETPDDAIIRETLEECGLVIRPGTWQIRAIEFVYSSTELTNFEKRSTFMEAVAEGVRGHSERDHKLMWLRTEAAIRALSHQSHSWALDRWREHPAASVRPRR